MSLLKKRARKKRLRSTLPDIGCPFCWEWLPKPTVQLGSFSGAECKGGRCECGAFFVVDETGKSGGAALLDVQAIACDGDLERAMALVEGVDFELRTKGYRGESGTRSGSARGYSYMDPKLWALRLRETG